jgi:uncharacterized membrane protein YjjP (DUF1212 family)
MDTSAVYAFGASSGLFIYQSVKGEYFKAALIPILGYGVSQLGRYYHSQKTHEVGYSIILGSILSLPGAAVGNVIYTFSEKTFTAKAIACLIGTDITWHFYNSIINYLEENNIVI